MVVDNTLMTQNVAVIAGTLVNHTRVRSAVAYVTDIGAPSKVLGMARGIVRCDPVTFEHGSLKLAESPF
jgi:methyl coenzyme M reductase subunit C-like uncharacterized protein (methanogenesis marker protein 7)